MASLSVQDEEGMLEHGGGCATARSHSVVARNLCRSYGKGRKSVNVLNGLDLTLPKRKIYGLLGPSGCGKTTLIKHIIGRCVFH